MNCCFFFSYATGDDLEATRHKRDFFDDLSDAVENHPDYRGTYTRAGFLDADIMTGSEWKTDVGAALMNCRAFVYLQEVTYFKFSERPWCGREWKVFRDRLEAHALTMGAGTACPPLMIPIVWRRMPNLPSVVADIQFKQRDLGEMYSGFDLFRMKSRPEYNIDYIDFLKRIANHIMHVVNAHPLAPATGLPRFADIADPFSVAVVPPPGPAKLGPRYVDFVYVVEEKARLQPYRNRLDSYDGTDDPKFWKPYYPPDRSAVAQVVEQTAHQQKFMPDRIACGSELLAALDRSMQAQRMVVLILDPWSLMVEACQALMKRFWRLRYWNAVILIPWHDDEETTRRSQEISDLVDEIFFDWRADDLRTGIRSREELIASLEATFLTIQKKLLKKANFRPVIGAGLRAVPGLSAVET